MELNQITVNHQGQLSSFTQQKQLTTGLTDYEQEIVAVKYKSPRIYDIQDHHREVVFKTLLFRIHTITGWKLPDDDLFLKILMDEFTKFLMERYHDLNADEITYAFRNYGTDVKDWGKSMNLSLIDEPISKYLSVRKCISEMEERKKVITEEKQIAPEFDKETLVQDTKTVFLKTRIVGLIPVKVYETLEQKGEINLTIDEKNAIRSRVISRLNQEAAEGGENEVRALKMMNNRDYEIRVMNECKKQAAANYFIKQQEIDNF